ncbi:MAG: glucose-6-phosphate isomerase family protein [Opitutaceae bacterium]
MLPDINTLLSRFDPATGRIPGAKMVHRHLGDLRGCFADQAAFEARLAVGNPLLYSVAGIEPAFGEGDLHYGVGLLMPGRVGDEYHLTKGHLHSWRQAAEIYIGLTGEGMMLLEDESNGRSLMAPLTSNQVVYVPGSTMHRTVNTGSIPLTYIGIYPAKAGHDYGAIAERNFRCVIVQKNGIPTLVERNQHFQ